jgi:ferric-dicitrate binding protein FerR (iron transport regulator)
LPSAADPAVGRQLDGDNATAAVSALATARRYGFAGRVFAVRANDRELTFVLPDGVELRFGDASDLAAKVAVARRILPLAHGFAYVDVSAPDRPVAGGPTLNSQVEP